MPSAFNNNGTSAVCIYCKFYLHETMQMILKDDECYFILISIILIGTNALIWRSNVNASTKKDFIIERFVQWSIISVTGKRKTFQLVFALNSHGRRNSGQSFYGDSRHPAYCLDGSLTMRFWISIFNIGLNLCTWQSGIKEATHSKGMLVR